MRIASLIVDLAAILGDAAARFEPDDLERHLSVSLADLARAVPMIKRDSLTLVADQPEYTAPADCLRIVLTEWGARVYQRTNPWDDNWPGSLPRTDLIAGQIVISPPPTDFQISVLGASFPFRYVASYVIGDTDAGTNIPDSLQFPLLLRAAAHALMELAANGVNKPVQLGGKQGISMPKNGTPGALAEQLIKQFETMAGSH